VNGRTLRGHQSVTLGLLFIAGMVNFLDRASLSIANTTVRAEMHLSATQMGWLLSAFSLAYGLAQLPLIGLLDRAGTRAVLGTGLGVWSVAQMLTGFVRGFPMFIALRVLLGVGESPFYPAGVRSVREWFSAKTRARATAVMSSSQAIGLACAPPLLTAIMLRLGWRAMFVVLGAAGLAVSAAWVGLHRARRETEFGEDVEPTSQRRDVGHPFPDNVTPGSTVRLPNLGHPVSEVKPERAWRVLIRQRTAWGMMLGWGGINYTVWLYVAWLPGYLQEQRHLSLARTGVVAAVPFLAAAAGMFTSGAVSDWLAHRGVPLTRVHRRNIVVGMIVSALSTFLVARSSTTAEAVAGISGALFCIHYAGTSGWGYVQTVSPLKYVASLGALQNFASFMIASAAPIVTGWLLDRTHSFTLALGVCSAVALLGALSYATLAAPNGMKLQA
jgi:MFS family permease